MNDFTPIKQNNLLPKGKEVLVILEKYVKYYPNMNIISLAPDEYDSLLMGMAKIQQTFYQNEMPYKGKIVKRADK